MKMLEQLNAAAKARRESGNCGPYPTGQENDVVAYLEIRDAHNELPNLSVEELAKETDCPVEFVQRVLIDLETT